MWNLAGLRSKYLFLTCRVPCFFCLFVFFSHLHYFQWAIKIYQCAQIWTKKLLPMLCDSLNLRYHQRLRQEDCCEFKNNLHYTVILCQKGKKKEKGKKRKERLDVEVHAFNLHWGRGKGQRQRGAEAKAKADLFEFQVSPDWIVSHNY